MKAVISYSQKSALGLKDEVLVHQTTNSSSTNKAGDRPPLRRYYVPAPSQRLTIKN